MAVCSWGDVMPSSGASRATMPGSHGDWRLTSITGSLTLPTSRAVAVEDLPLGAGVYRTWTPLLGAAAWAFGALMTWRNHRRANRAANRQPTTTSRIVRRTCVEAWTGVHRHRSSLGTDDPETRSTRVDRSAPTDPRAARLYSQLTGRASTASPGGLDHRHLDQPRPAGVEEWAVAEHVGRA